MGRYEFQRLEAHTPSNTPEKPWQTDHMASTISLKLVVPPRQSVPAHALPPSKGSGPITDVLRTS
jgi:hypothetical protein